MNLLKERLPSTVEVGGFSFKIDTRYDTALVILDLLGDELFTPEERQQMVLDMFYPGERPKEDMVALCLMFDFLNMGEPPAQDTGRRKTNVLDFEKDGNAIYSHFLRVFGIDLQENPIHWWKFNALLQDSGEKTLLQTLITIRTTKLSDVPDDKRAEVARLQREVAVEGPKIKHDETLEERNARWARGE